MLLPDLDGTAATSTSTRWPRCCDRRAGHRRRRGASGSCAAPTCADGRGSRRGRVVHGLPQRRRFGRGDVRQRHPGVRPLPVASRDWPRASCSPVATRGGVEACTPGRTVPITVEMGTPRRSRPAIASLVRVGRSHAGRLRRCEHAQSARGRLRRRPRGRRPAGPGAAAAPRAASIPDGPSTSSSSSIEATGTSPCGCTSAVSARPARVAPACVQPPGRRCVVTAPAPGTYVHRRCARRPAGRHRARGRRTATDRPGRARTVGPGHSARTVTYVTASSCCSGTSPPIEGRRRGDDRPRWVVGAPT